MNVEVNILTCEQLQRFFDEVEKLKKYVGEKERILTNKMRVETGKELYHTMSLYQILKEETLKEYHIEVHGRLLSVSYQVQKIVQQLNEK